jgi:hypothetical protein
LVLLTWGYLRLDAASRYFLAPLAILIACTVLYYAYDYLKERTEERRWEGVGTDYAALQAELARTPKTETRYVNYGHGSWRIQGFDPHLGPLPPEGAEEAGSKFPP